ncbi:hypothetical protein V499_08116 [Pseudogymnoascus sp. VKM F-103]|nr:hypothetical protein V499_08116 [Pseudogymnoascus sp. VKM F-103]
MIDPTYRFWSPYEDKPNGGPYSWHILDCDQRRWVTVTGSPKAVPRDPDAIKILRRHIDQLDPAVHKITVSDEGDIVSISSDPNDEAAWFVHYPRYDPRDVPNGHTTLMRTQMEEVDRVGHSVDMVRYEDGPGKSQLGIFKYSMIYIHLDRIWNELQIMMALPKHELIVPFGRIVLDDVEPRILGFTVPFIPGGTFDENKTRPFRFAWLQQLTSLVDELHFKFGIYHQDIAGRNIVVDPVTGKIRLFDFEFAAKIGSPSVDIYRNDIDQVIFTIYEILTLDVHFREIASWDQDVKAIEEMAEWDVKIPIEAGNGGIKEIRSFLAEWAAGRRSKAQNGPVNATSQLDWPGFPPQTPVLYTSRDRAYNIEGGVRHIKKAKNAIFEGQHVVRWERPSTKSLLANKEN